MNDNQQLYKTFNLGPQVLDDKDLITILQDPMHNNLSITSEIYKNTFVLNVNKLDELKKVIKEKIYNNKFEKALLLFSMRECIVKDFSLFGAIKETFFIQNTRRSMDLHFYLFEEISKITANFFTDPSKETEQIIKDNKKKILRIFTELINLTEYGTSYKLKDKEFAKKTIKIISYHNMQLDDSHFVEKNIHFKKLYKYTSLDEVEKALKQKKSFKEIFDNNPFFMILAEEPDINFESIFLKENGELNLTEIMSAIKLVKASKFYACLRPIDMEFTVIDNLLKDKVGEKIMENKEIFNIIKKLILKNFPQNEENKIKEFNQFIKITYSNLSLEEFNEFKKSDVLFNIGIELLLIIPVNFTEIGFENILQNNNTFEISINQLQEEFKNFLKTEEENFTLSGETKKVLTKIFNNNKNGKHINSSQFIVDLKNYKQENNKKLSLADEKIIDFLIEYHLESKSPSNLFNNKKCIQSAENFTNEIYKYHAEESVFHPGKNSLLELARLFQIREYNYRENINICFKSMLFPNQGCSFLDVEKFKQIQLYVAFKEFLVMLFPSYIDWKENLPSNEILSPVIKELQQNKHSEKIINEKGMVWFYSNNLNPYEILLGKLLAFEDEVTDTKTLTQEEKVIKNEKQEKRNTIVNEILFKYHILYLLEKWKLKAKNSQILKIFILKNIHHNLISNKQTLNLEEGSSLSKDLQKCEDFCVEQTLILKNIINQNFKEEQSLSNIYEKNEEIAIQTKIDNQETSLEKKIANEKQIPEVKIENQEAIFEEKIEKKFYKKDFVGFLETELTPREQNMINKNYTFSYKIYENNIQKNIQKNIKDILEFKNDKEFDIIIGNIPERHIREFLTETKRKFENFKKKNYDTKLEEVKSTINIEKGKDL